LKGLTFNLVSGEDAFLNFQIIPLFPTNINAQEIGKVCLEIQFAKKLTNIDK